MRSSSSLVAVEAEAWLGAAGRVIATGTGVACGGGAREGSVWCVVRNSLCTVWCSNTSWLLVSTLLSSSSRESTEGRDPLTAPLVTGSLKPEYLAWLRSSSKVSSSERLLFRTALLVLPSPIRCSVRTSSTLSWRYMSWPLWWVEVGVSWWAGDWGVAAWEGVMVF